MTQEEFLLDTLEYYSVDPKNRRCSSKSRYLYSPVTAKNKESEGCGIGRKLLPEVAYMYDQLKDNTGICEIFRNYPYLRSKAPLWMQAMDREFLSSIQSLHDAGINWNGAGVLSSWGKHRVENIINYHSLNREIFQKFL